MAAPLYDLATADTIEAPSPVAAQIVGDASNSLEPTRPRMALVAGATPHLSGEMHSVLRSRLRIVAVLLLIGFGVFLAWTFVMSLMDARWVERGPLFYAHVALTALLAVLAWKLCGHCNLSLRTLRVAELLTFGAPAVYFAVLNYQQIQHAASATDYPRVTSITSGWMLLVFYYAIFVPNAWRRAAAVIGVLAAAPVALNLWMYATFDPYARLVDSDAFRGALTEQALKMGIAAMAAIVGVHTINTLRREAFAAKQLGQYRLKRLLGSGGMGEVYLAEHQMMKRPCAVKIIRPEKAGDPQVLARFEREVRATAKLSHWNSVDIFDYGRTADGTFYYVMEFLPGHNLGELVDGHGPLPMARIVYLMRQVCDALTEAHGQGLVHRDLKPANIYCAYRGGMFDVAKVLDFGLAKPMTDAADSGLTLEGSITGSPLFMSPEQAQSDDVDVRSDVYSLGAVMYFMATGRAPFLYENPLKVMIAHASEDPDPPRLYNSDISVELEEAILRSLEKRPEDRFQTVAELREALDRAPIDGEWTARHAADWWRDYGCPQRKAMAAEAAEMAAV
ncbi:MAG TPA: serine/threonine-protein kinase [Lacipirellulaceae bacterium]|nr:serine/threonine-protein kinase [Lacipirellulaceae bacterium]